MFLLRLLSPPALACLYDFPGWFDPVPDAGDVEAPGAPGQPVSVHVWRGTGPQYAVEDGLCEVSYNVCNDGGGIDLSFAAALDAGQTEPVKFENTNLQDRVGYRFRSVSGSPPPELWYNERPTRAYLNDQGQASLFLLWGDEATNVQEPIDFVLGIQAVDFAGNEGGELQVRVEDPGSMESPLPAECGGHNEYPLCGEGSASVGLGLLLLGAPRRRERRQAALRLPLVDAPRPPPAPR